MVRRVALVVAAALAPLRLAAAQSTMVPEGGAPGTGGTKFHVSISNQSPHAVRFLLRPKDGSWSEYTLDKDQRSAFSCLGCGGTFQISISTAGTVVSYDLKAGQPYLIRLNPTRNIFDVYRVD
jgi:hypothetical protein